MERYLKKKTDRFALWTWGICMMFCGVSAMTFFLRENWVSGLICLGTMGLVSLPVLAEQWLHWKLNRGFFLFCLLYAMGPMLGKAFKLYYLTTWWDKLLHTSAGFVFAVVGAYLAERLNRGRDTSMLLQVLFGIFFSIAVSGLWELVEFSVDRIFGADMQNDTVVHAIHSYLLSDVPGVLYQIPEIGAVSVNGTPLDIGGYLDIGLFDTMYDMLVETLGALVFGLWHLADRGRHPMIQTASDPC